MSGNRTRIGGDADFLTYLLPIRGKRQEPFVVCRGNCEDTMLKRYQMLASFIGEKVARTF